MSRMHASGAKSAGRRGLSLIGSNVADTGQEVVRAALVRSFTRSAFMSGRLEDADILVFVNPLDRHADLIQRRLEDDCKIVVFGSIGPKTAELLGLRLGDGGVGAEDMQLVDSGRGFRQSAARIEYSGTEEGDWLVLPFADRPFIRDDFDGEWNNHGYGSIILDHSPWAVSTDAGLQGAREISRAVGQSGACVMCAVKDYAHAACLYVNRAVGMADSPEWVVVERFISSYRWRELPVLPVLLPLPSGFSSAFTVRLDCDEAISSARPLAEMYWSHGVPLSLALKTSLDISAGDKRFMTDIVRHGGSIVSHSHTHPPDWGGADKVADEVSRARGVMEDLGLRREWGGLVVSPFHLNSVPTIKALEGAGVKAFVGGSIAADPEFILGRPGVVPYSDNGLVSHTQQCMLHGDCYHAYGNSVSEYLESMEHHFRVGAPFGCLDHPFSERYAYGWDSEEERVSAHQRLLQGALGREGVWFPSLAELLSFFIERDGVNVWVDDSGLHVDAATTPVLQPAIFWKDETLYI